MWSVVEIGSRTRSYTDRGRLPECAVPCRSMVSSERSLQDDVATWSSEYVNVYELRGPTGFPNHIENKISSYSTTPRKAIVPAPAKKTLSSSQQYISPMEPNPGDKEKDSAE
eukprot:COSAG02_NODE_3115_length_7335_cov_2.741017_5_plen_112_part_00